MYVMILAQAHLYFNSQPHKEADECSSMIRPVKKISTHSLTRRLTISVYIWQLPRAFQLTASQGG